MKKMSLKILVKLSHFITMMFGIALGMSICIYYQYSIDIFIDKLSPFIIAIVLFSGVLRIYTLVVWKNGGYKSKLFNE